MIASRVNRVLEHNSTHLLVAAMKSSIELVSMNMQCNC